MEDIKKRKITLFGATSMTIGIVIGASMFIMIPSVVGMTGTGAVLTYFLAGLPIAFGCLNSIQIAGTFPTSGGGYMMSSMYATPSVAFAVSATTVGAVGTCICFQAYAAAAFIQLYLPNVSVMLIAIIIIVLFGVLNLVGVSAVSGIENLMFIVLVVATIVFIGGGIQYTDSSNYTSLMPEGVSPFVMAIGVGVFSWLGLSAICSYAGEIKQPAKTIPRALIIALVVLAAAYCMMALVFSGCYSMATINTLGDTVASNLASLIGGPLLKNILTVALICAVLTSVNGYYLIASREMEAWSHQQTVPAFFGKRHPKTKTPVVNIIILLVYTVIFAFFEMSLKAYSLIVVFPMMLAQFVQALACYRMLKLDPERYNNSGIKLKRRTLIFSLVSNSVACVLVIAFSSMASPKSGLVALGLLIISFIWYFSRRAYLAKKGINLDLISRQVDKDIEAEIANQ